MASSSDAVKPRQSPDTSEVARGRTWVEGGLKGGEPVILEHMQKSLWGIQLVRNMCLLESQRAYGLSGVIKTEE